MNKKILLVDDHKEIVELTKKLLEKRGYQVAAFEEVDDIFLLIEEQTPDLVILDHILPGKTGSELCHEIKSNKNTSHLPVLIITGQVLLKEPTGGDPSHIKADDYLIKPFDFEELIAKVNNFFNKDDAH